MSSGSADLLRRPMGTVAAGGSMCGGDKDSRRCGVERARSLQPGNVPRPLTRKEVLAFAPSPDAYFHASHGCACRPHLCALCAAFEEALLLSFPIPLPDGGALVVLSLALGQGYPAFDALLLPAEGGRDAGEALLRHGH